MEIKNSLKDFCEFYIKNNFFVYKKLGEVENTCYPESELIVIDYDEVKRKCYTKHFRGLKDFQSCDALKILDSEVDFIEMKSLSNFLEYDSPENREKMLNKNFSRKLEDSMYIFKTLLMGSTLNLKKEQIDSILGSLRYYIVLTDVKLSTPEEFLARLDFLANPVNNEKALDKVVNKILSDLHKTENKFQIEAKLMFTEDLDYLYSA
jgi:hypothetical protein